MDELHLIQAIKEMKILVTIFSFLNGAYMLLDGMYVMLKGKYIGPEKPGPWAGIFSSMNVNVFRLGPVFILFGLLWLTWLYGLWTHQSWVYTFGIVISILTLWYLPLGTLFSSVILLALIFAKGRLGIH